MPIDAFLHALAADRGNKAIGVILSGTASDGTLGLKAIKAAGGITFAQDVQTARYDSMPRSAIATGVVDFVLAPAEIARQLAAIGRNSELQVGASGGGGTGGRVGAGQDTPPGAQRHGSGLHAL